MTEPPAAAERVTLFVEYDSADDFVGDYDHNLATGATFVLTSRRLEPGTPVRLVLGFPGLLEPIALDGVVRALGSDGEAGLEVEFLAGPGLGRLAPLVDRIARRDPAVVARVINVLVAEDNPHMSELIRDGLRASARRTFGADLAFWFATAEHGRAAVELLRSTAFDAAIIDVYLPVLDGTGVIEHARGALGLTDLPIIAVSGGGDEARQIALAAGANIFLDKPMRLRQVVETMRELVKL